MMSSQVCMSQIQRWVDDTDTAFTSHEPPCPACEHDSGCRLRISTKSLRLSSEIEVCVCLHWCEKTKVEILVMKHSIWEVSACEGRGMGVCVGHTETAVDHKGTLATGANTDG